MAKLADLFVKLGLKNDDFDKGIDKSKKKVGGFAKSLKKVGGLIAGAFAIGAVKSFVTESVRLYNIQAQAENQLLVALKGRGDVQRMLLKQATELQRKTLFGDEETIKAQALIAAFVKEGDQIERIIPLVQDLAAAKNMDLSVSADLVSKTLGSSTNALSRYGIEVEGAVGSVERLESLMGGLNDAFGGQAEAAAKVGTAALTQLGNAFGDLKEVIGELTISQQNQQGSLTKILTSATSGVTKFLTKIATFSQLGLGLKTSLGAALFGDEEDFNMIDDALSKSAAALNETNKSIQTFVMSGEDFDEMINTIEKSLDEARITLKEATKGVDEWFNAWLKAPDVSGIVGGGGVFGMFSPENDEDVDIDTEAYAKRIQDAKDFTEELNAVIGQGVANFVSTFAEGIGQLASGNIGFEEFFNAILSQVGAFLVQLGELLVAYGIAESAFLASLNPGVKIAAGVALIAIGGAIKGLSSKGIGGSSSSVSSGGSSATGYSTQGRSRASQDTVIFELRGDKLIGVINNTNRKNSIIG